MTRFCSLTLFCFISLAGFAQVVNTATMDTLETTVLGHVGFGGYVDTYYGYNFNKPATGNQPYLVSSARNNEFSINLAYIDVRYRTKNIRARFVPGFGTYMNANYADEPGSLAHIVEGYVGVKPFDHRNIWVDVGVFGSPYTNESAISKDHLMYSRSLAPEYVPYYLSGVKANIPLHTKWTLNLFLLNGWQVIQDTNNGKSLGTQLEYRPSSNLLLNWNTYVGDERSASSPLYRTRYFSDVFMIYQPVKRLSITSCVYGGVQQHANRNHTKWWQANLIGRWSFNDRVSLSGRMEYFHDPSGTVVKSLSGNRFTTASSGLCLNMKVSENALFRLEERTFFSKEVLYEKNSSGFARSSTMLTSSLTVWF